MASRSVLHLFFVSPNDFDCQSLIVNDRRWHRPPCSVRCCLTSPFPLLVRSLACRLPVTGPMEVTERNQNAYASHIEDCSMFAKSIYGS